MSNLSELFDALYSRFLLRDVFAKIIPGALALLAIGLWWGGPAVNLSWLAGLDRLWVWLLLFGLSWPLGLGIQRLGEVIHFVRYFPPSLQRNILEYNAQFLFAVSEQLSTSYNVQHRRRIERFEIVKESTGNTATALLLVLGVLIARLGFESGPWVFQGEFARCSLRILPSFLSGYGSHPRFAVDERCEC